MNLDRVQQIAICTQTMPECFNSAQKIDTSLSKLNSAIEILQNKYSSNALDVFDKGDFSEIYLTLRLANERLIKMETSKDLHYRGILESHDAYVHTGRQEYLNREEKSRVAWREFGKFFGYKHEKVLGMKYLFGRYIDFQSFSPQVESPLSFEENHNKRTIIYTDKANSYFIRCEKGFDTPFVMHIDNGNARNSIISLESAFNGKAYYP